MKEIRFVVRFTRQALAVLAGVLFIAPTAFALSPSEREAVTSFLKIYRQSTSFADLSERLSALLPQDGGEYLKKYAAQFPNEKLPKVELRADDQLVLSQSGRVISFEILSGRKSLFKFNQRTISCDQESFHDCLIKINGALPSYTGKSSALFRILVPELHAFVPFVIPPAAVLAYSATTAVVAGVASYFVWNDGECKDYSTSLKTCQRYSHRGRRKIDASKGLKKAFSENRAPLGKECPKDEDLDEDFEEEIKGNRDEIETTLESKMSSLTSCSDLKEKMKSCLETEKKVIVGLCYKHREPGDPASATQKPKSVR